MLPCLEQIRQLHALFLTSGGGKFPSQLLLRDVVLLCNTIIRAYTNGDNPQNAILFFNHMLSRRLKPNNLTFPFLFKTCSKLCLLKVGVQIHGFVSKTGHQADIFVHNSLLNMYSVNGDLGSSRTLFDLSYNRDTVSWNTMIMGYAHGDKPEEAFQLFGKMVSDDYGGSPNQITMVALLCACSKLKRMDLGKWVHDYINICKFNINLILRTAIVDMYAKCGCLNTARRIFDEIPDKNVVSWNVMISGYVRGGYPSEAMASFAEMQASGVRPNGTTMLILFSVCAQLRDLNLAQRAFDYVHKNMIKFSLNLQNASIDMYAKCGDIEAARVVFNEMPEKDRISWTSMITGYVKFSQFDEALSLFREMQVANVKPDEVTLVSLLSLSAEMGAMELGRWIHVFMDRNSVKPGVCLNTALISMYSKCGVVEQAIEVFNKMPVKNSHSWTAIISGLAINGRAEQALSLFEDMRREGVKPDEITFVAILTACTHAGLVNEGHRYFRSMTKSYGIEPKVEHYACMVDLLGRAGLLREARDIIEVMPMEPSASVLGSLLSSCRILGNVEMGEELINKYFGDSSEAYVNLSNLYAEAERWGDVERVREVMKGLGRRERMAGGSLLEVNGGVHEFLCGKIQP